MALPKKTNGKIDNLSVRSVWQRDHSSVKRKRICRQLHLKTLARVRFVLFSFSICCFLNLFSKKLVHLKISLPLLFEKQLADVKFRPGWCQLVLRLRFQFIQAGIARQMAYFPLFSVNLVLEKLLARFLHYSWASGPLGSKHVVAFAVREVSQFECHKLHVKKAHRPRKLWRYFFWRSFELYRSYTHSVCGRGRANDTCVWSHPLSLSMKTIKVPYRY